MYEEQNSWAICFRQTLPVRGNHTNNFAEAAVRVLKDKVFLRTKAFNVPQLLDFLTTRMSRYYEQRLVDLANNRTERVIQSRFLQCKSTIDPAKIVRVSAEEFEVSYAVHGFNRFSMKYLLLGSK